MESTAANVVSLMGRLPVSHPDKEARALEERVWAHDVSLINNLSESQRKYIPDEEDAIVLGAVYQMTKEQIEWYYKFDYKDLVKYSAHWKKWVNDAVYFKGLELKRELTLEEKNAAVFESMIIETHRAFWVLRHSGDFVFILRNTPQLAVGIKL